MFLKQATSVDVKVGPFLDETDGKTAETGLTITQPDIRLAKNGGNWAQKAAAQTLTHEEAGWYELTLDATDTDTCGKLIVAIHESGALPVWKEYHVIEEAIYDALFAASANAFTGAAGSTTLTALATGSITAAVVATGAIDADAIADNAIDAGAIAADAITAAKIADGAIDAATFAAGAITATVIATGAIDADALAADASTEINAAVLAILGTPAGASMSADIAAIEAQTDDIGAAGAGLTAADDAILTILGTPAGASLSADVAAVKVDTAAILVDTGTTLDGRIPAALVGGRMDSSVGAMAANVMTAAAAAADLTTELQSGLATQASVDTIDNFLDTEIADILTDTSTTIDDFVDDLEGRLTAALATALQAHGLGIGRLVVAAGSTTTAVVFSTVNGGAPSATDDFYNGRHIIFTSGALTLQATSISDYTGATATATVPALTGAPADTVTGIIV